LSVLRQFHERAANDTCGDRPLNSDEAEGSVAVCPWKVAERMAGSAHARGARRSNLVEIEMADRSGVVRSPAVIFRHTLLFDFGR
jgi:hypothetical protein